MPARTGQVDEGYGGGVSIWSTVGEPLVVPARNDRTGEPFSTDGLVDSVYVHTATSWHDLIQLAVDSCDNCTILLTVDEARQLLATLQAAIERIGSA